MYVAQSTERGNVIYSGQGVMIPGTPTLATLTEHFVSKVDSFCHPNFTPSDHSQEAGGEAKINRSPPKAEVATESRF